MTANWLPPPPKVDMVGHITYRCHECGELIEGTDYVLVPLDVMTGKVTSDTRSYHTEHMPPLEVTNGR